VRPIVLFVMVCLEYPIPFVLSFVLLAKLVYQIERTDPRESRTPITRYAYQEMLKAEEGLKSLASGAPREMLEEKRRKIIEGLESTLGIWSHMHYGKSAREERQIRAKDMVETFDRSGIGVFRPLNEPGLFPSPLVPGQEEKFAQAVGLLLLAMAVSQFLQGLGMTNQDLGTVSWSLEWLYTLPAPAWVLFAARIFEYTVVNPFAWFMVLPFHVALLSSFDLGFLGVPLGIAATLPAVVLVASLRVVAETWLRKTFSLDRLKNFQALSTVLGMLLFLGILWAAMSPEVPEAFLALARRFPQAALWNPFSLPALFTFRGPVRWLASGALIASAGLLALGAALASQRLVREGLVVAPNVHQGERSAPAGGFRERGWLPGGMVGKDLRLLLRDRNLLVQMFLVPILILGFQLVVNPGILRSAAGDFRHAAALAFGVGSYVYCFSTLRSLALEGEALWIVYTFPQPLHALVFRKAFLPCAVATTYALFILIIAGANAQTFGPGALPVCFLALAGVVIHGFIAAALGALGTDPLEIEPRRRVSQGVVYLYLFFAGIYVAGIFIPSNWTAGVQIVLYAALACVLWKKVREQLPFLLDRAK